jgi:hypothetical protein
MVVGLPNRNHFVSAPYVIELLHFVYVDCHSNARIVLQVTNYVAISSLVVQKLCLDPVFRFGTYLRLLFIHADSVIHPDLVQKVGIFFTCLYDYFFVIIFLECIVVVAESTFKLIRKSRVEYFNHYEIATYFEIQP